MLLRPRDAGADDDGEGRQSGYNGWADGKNYEARVIINGYVAATRYPLPASRCPGNDGLMSRSAAKMTSIRRTALAGAAAPV